MNNFFNLFLFLVLFLPSSLTAYTNLGFKDGPIARKAYSEKIFYWFCAKKFAQLDAEAEKLRKTKECLPEGLWKIEFFYEGLTPWKNVNSQVDYNDFYLWLKNWQQQHPDSITAKIVEAKYYIDYAQKARWKNWKYSIPGKKNQSFKNLLNDSHSVIKELYNQGKNCPELYLLWLRLPMDIIGGQAEYDKVFNEGIAKYPTFYPLYFLKATTLRGDKKSQFKFIEESTEKTKSELGYTLYARICWAEWAADYTFLKSTKPYFKWELMNKGLKDIEKKYPNSIWNLNNYCHFACQVKDKQTAKKLFDRIGDNHYPKAWQRLMFKNAKKWAYEK